ncbi:finTRIM family, member 14 [Silurus asotus]|uniref:FinTRIM family, member 14 n=1 Tax=Silurus asotus TaxID=30991 RepID=A0AAD5FR06_SILAS|nr:finTRIM family, member 14 [Silurus asotus]
MLAEVVEKLKKTELQDAFPAHCYAGPGDVECDSCSGRKLKAVKSCLVCQASYCEDHLKPHYQSQAFRKHKLIEAWAGLQEKICSQHDKLIEIHCLTDQSFICYLCTMDEHKGHDMVVAEAERKEKQVTWSYEESCALNDIWKEDGIKRQVFSKHKNKRISSVFSKTEEKVRSEAVDDSERTFTELISSIEKRRSEVKEMIRAQEKAELSRAEHLLKQLEQEIADLKRKITDMEQLSHTHDHIHFLQTFLSLCVSPGSDSSHIAVNQNISFEGVKNSVSELKKRVEEICQGQMYRIAVQEDLCYLTLDPNTAHRKLVLSENNREVTHVKKKQNCFDHPERFDHWVQVLCRESVIGRCYWEVEWNGNNMYIAVAYKEIGRKGGSIECAFGRNSQSWSLRCCSSSVSFLHDDITTKLQGSVSSRIGVHVDHSAGTLSFYSISNVMRLLHRVHTTFTQPLYAGFMIWEYDSTVKLCHPVVHVDESDEESD